MENASRAGVIPGLAQYYFPTDDSLFAAMLQRLIDRDLERWNVGLGSRERFLGTVEPGPKRRRRNRPR